MRKLGLSVYVVVIGLTACGRHKNNNDDLQRDNDNLKAQVANDKTIQEQQAAALKKAQDTGAQPSAQSDAEKAELTKKLSAVSEAEKAAEAKLAKANADLVGAKQDAAAQEKAAAAAQATKDAADLDAAKKATAAQAAADAAALDATKATAATAAAKSGCRRNDGQAGCRCRSSPSDRGGHCC